MKISKIVSACLLLIAVNANAGERPLNLNYNPAYNDFRCSTNFCKTLTSDQKATLNQMIEDKIRDQNLDGDSEGATIFVKSSQVDLFGEALNSKQSDAFDTESTDTFMAFRYLVNSDTYLSADLLLQKSLIEDDKSINVDLNVVGVGKQFKDNLTVEVGIIKDFKKRPGVVSNKFDLGPNGLLLIIKKRW